MFGFSKKKGEVTSHWYSLIPDFNTSTREFYDAVEKELKERQLPGLELFHVEFSEGGVLSAKREYLRMTRERLIFDICAAPFGTSYFFSCRFAEIPAVIQPWHLIVLFLAFVIAIPFSFAVFVKIFGLLAPFIWPVAWIAFFIIAIYTMRNAVALGLKDLDATLVKSPVIGPIYERWFRRETYYREDTRLMYHNTVDAVVKAKVEEVTGAKGIKLIRFNEYSPILGELYKPTDVQLPSKPPVT
jgi:hypothetical protein